MICENNRKGEKGSPYRIQDIIIAKVLTGDATEMVNAYQHLKEWKDIMILSLENKMLTGMQQI